MKLWIVGIFCLFLPVSVQAQMLISGGKDGGTYSAIAENIQRVLQREGLQARVENSAGSLQNLQRLHDALDDTVVTLSQADALSHYVGQHPDFAADYATALVGPRECVLMITAMDSPLRNTDDLIDGYGYSVAIHDPDSGTALTWRNMQAQIPGLENMRTEYRSIDAALTDLLLLGASGRVGAVMTVQRPGMESSFVRVLRENRDRVRLIDLNDERFMNQLPGGGAVYTREAITVRSGWLFDEQVQTLCTPMLVLVAQRKIDADQFYSLERALVSAGKKLFDLEDDQ